MIEVINGDTKDRNIEEFYQRRKDQNSMLLFSKIYSIDHMELMYPYSIEIETVNRCNNDCSFCAVNRNNDSRKHITMSSELFYSVIEQCKTMDYRGYLSLFSNNEPLLDKRICEFVDYARKKLPETRLALFTNGILLKEDIFLYLIDRLDYLVIDNYNDDMTAIPTVQKILDKYQNIETDCNVKVYLRKKHQILSSRGGDAPNREHDITYESGCMMPFMQIVIRPDGKISKCCQDGLGHSTIGDLKKESLMESWKNKQRIQLCEGMIRSGRKSRRDCWYCDVFGHDNYMPPEWKPLIISSFLDIVSENYMKKKNIVLVGRKMFCSQMKRLLETAGIRGICERDENSIQIKLMDFYVVENFDCSILKKIDPYAEYAGKKWVVPENILTYMIRDYSEHALKFARVLGSLLNAYQTPLYFVGDMVSYRFLTENISIRCIRRAVYEELLSHSDNIEKSGVFLIDHTAVKEKEILLKEWGISPVQILDYDLLLSFAKGE